MRETIPLHRPSGGVPNHPGLPVVLRRGALPEGARTRQDVERRAAPRGWRGFWEGGVYGFHHFHADTHEALAVLDGRARIELGGPEGAVVELRGGDLVVIPAGVGHRCVEADEAFAVVGCYPDGRAPDLELPTSLSETEAAARVAQVAPWPVDPLDGSPLLPREGLGFAAGG